ncbi:hypothetical protein O181_030229 [Austropuccinia psidii MF-1]|uniref:DNA polymerase epsilon subunit B n=1 Tax=Austropuccinia psidii MF-1 TaxID=1389203 RepID=A0A9Q3CSG0_9BASI|nr:hypothetical protein [Austropuccinia psidii MF-1]
MLGLCLLNELVVGGRGSPAAARPRRLFRLLQFLRQDFSNIPSYPFAMPPVDQTRSIIHRIFSKEHALILRGDALRWIQDMLVHYQVAPQDLEDTLNVLATACESHAASRDTSAVVDQDILQEVYEKLEANTVAEPSLAGADSQEIDNAQMPELQTLKVVDAFSIPRLTWSEERKIFEPPSGEASPSSILGRPSSKALYLRDRYHTIRQVILRNEHFSPPIGPGALNDQREEYMKLTSTNNLLGRAGQRFLLFGMLNRMKDNSYCLEDLDGRVKLDFSLASAAEGLFTEGCLVLAEGEYKANETFQVLEIGHPPSEQRAVSRKLFGHIDFLGCGAISLAEETRLKKQERNSDSQFIIISDVHLDHPKVLINLEQILKGYDNQLIESDETMRPPGLWILCGDFCQKPFVCDSTMISMYQNLFTKLATTFSQFPRVTQHIHLVLIPGPHDPWDSTTLPRPSLPRCIVKPLLHPSTQIPKENLHLASNPCRIRWMSQELVILRDNLASKMCRNIMSDVLKDPTLATHEAEVDVTKYLVQTLLDQGHLSPFSINTRPILWEYDQALRLYPMPTTLVLADAYPPYNLTYEGCHVFNPGSFGVGSRPTWANYYVATRTSEPSELAL